MQKKDRNESGDPIETQIGKNPSVPPAPIRHAVPPIYEPGKNEAGDPVISAPHKKVRNEAGDIKGVEKNPTIPPPPQPSAAPLPVGAIGRNESGDAIFPRGRGKNEAGDAHQGSLSFGPRIIPTRPRCVNCGGSGKVPYQDRRGHPGLMACPACDGNGEAK